MSVQHMELSEGGCLQCVWNIACREHVLCGSIMLDGSTIYRIRTVGREMESEDGVLLAARQLFVIELCRSMVRRVDGT